MDVTNLDYAVPGVDPEVARQPDSAAAGQICNSVKQWIVALTGFPRPCVESFVTVKRAVGQIGPVVLVDIFRECLI